jgi:NADH-quinone oxidoreductase subunit B
VLTKSGESYPFLLGKLDELITWSQRNSLWPFGSGLACCAIEMIATAAAKFDISRFGMELFRASPRQADLFIVAGTVTNKMAPVIRRLWEQMPDPKWVVAMGNCAISGGPFPTYAVLQGVDKIIPVDVYVAGCPPSPQGLLHGLMTLQTKISRTHPTLEMFDRDARRTD